MSPGAAWGRGGGRGWYNGGSGSLGGLRSRNRGLVCDGQSPSGFCCDVGSRRMACKSWSDCFERRYLRAGLLLGYMDGLRGRSSGGRCVIVEALTIELRLLLKWRSTSRAQWYTQQQACRKSCCRG